MDMAPRQIDEQLGRCPYCRIAIPPLSQHGHSRARSPKVEGIQSPFFLVLQYSGHSLKLSARVAASFYSVSFFHLASEWMVLCGMTPWYDVGRR